MPVRDAGEPSEAIRQRVNNVRDIQLRRFQKRNIHSNAQMGARDIKRYCSVNDDAEKLLETAINKLGLSAQRLQPRPQSRRTIADLAGTEEIQPPTSPKRFSIGAWTADFRTSQQKT